MNTYLIKKKEDFAHVFRNGSFLNCSSFTINYAKKSKAVNINLPRFGIVASKKVGNGSTIIATRTKMPVDSISADTVELKPAPPNFCSVIIMTFNSSLRFD